MKFHSLILAASLLAFSCASAFAADPVPAGKLNVNTATEEQLAKVPGLSPELAKAILKYREEMGDIQNVDELTEVPGITPDVLGTIKEHLGTEGISGSECSC